MPGVCTDVGLATGVPLSVQFVVSPVVLYSVVRLTILSIHFMIDWSAPIFGFGKKLRFTRAVSGHPEFVEAIN